MMMIRNLLFCALVAAVALFSLQQQQNSADAAVITSISPRGGSLAGGTRLTVSGTGFDMRGRSNDIFIGQGTKGSFCDPVPNECTTTRIVCLTDIPGDGVQPLSVRSFGFLADCQVSGGCTFEYSASYTPEVTSISPEWIANVPTALTVMGSHFSQGDGTVANFDFTLHIGEEERCELLNSVSANSFACNVHSMRPGALPLDLVMGAFGRAKWAAGAKTTLLVIPTINKVAPATGSLRGGTIVTISGTSFSTVLAENEIRIHGALCPAVSYAATYITCRTSPHAATVAAATPAFQYGKVQQEFWYNLPGGSIATNWQNKIEYLTPQESIIASSVTDLARKCESCAVRTTFYFYAPTAGAYTFSGSFDDNGELWISPDESPVERAQELLSAVVLDVTPFNTRRVLSSTCCSTTTGSAITLTQGWHWARVYLKQASGGLGQSLSVMYPDNSTHSFASIMSTNIAYRAPYTPPVTASVRGVNAIFDVACGTYGSCRFDYSNAVTAVVASVTPGTAVTGGSVITITGTGFDTSTSAPATLPATCASVNSCGGGGCNCKTSTECGYFSSLCQWTSGSCGFINPNQASCNTWSNNIVTLCGAPCYVTSQLSTELRCSVGYGLPAGNCLVEVQVGTLGRAISAAEITVAPVIELVTPNAGYLTGGNTITIFGSGFDITVDSTGKVATTVSIGGANCPVIGTTTYYRVSCITPAGTSGAQTVLVTVRGQIRSVAYDIVAFSGAYNRPGTSQTDLPISVTPTKAGVRGADRLIIATPGRAFPSDAKITVTFGSTYNAPVLSTSAEAIVVASPQLDTPRILSASVVIKDSTNTNTLFSFTTPKVDFNSVITSSTNFINPAMSNRIWIYGDFQAARQADVKVAVGGQACQNVDFDPFNNVITCDAQPKLAIAPALPTLQFYDFTPSGLTSVLSGFHTSGSVIQNSDATVTIPAGSQYIMSKLRYTRPFAFEAKVRPTKTAAAAANNGQINMRFCFDDPTSSAGYVAAIGRNADGNFGLGVDSAWTSTTKEYTGSFAGIGMDPSTVLTLRVEAYNQFINFYVNGVLAKTISDRTYLSGKIGFGFSQQQFTVGSITVSDLYPLATQVNVSGVPMRAYTDTLYDSVPVVVTSMPVRNFQAGGEVVAYLDTWVSSPRVYALRSATEQVSAYTPLLCTGYLSRTLTGAIKFTCAASSLPQGNYYWLVVSTDRGCTTQSFPGTFVSSLSGVTPNIATNFGGVITVSGAGFIASTRVKIGSADCNTIWQNERKILCSAAALVVGNQAVTVVTGTYTAPSCGTDCVVAVSTPADPAPVISSLDAAFGALPRAITIFGTNFNSAVNAWIANNDCSVSSRIATKIVIYCTYAPAGSQTIQLQLSGVNGLFSTTFTVQAGATTIAPSSGSTQGGTEMTITSNALPAGDTSANLASHDFASGVQSGWTGAVPSTTYLCNGDSILGLLSSSDVSRSFSNVAAHAAVKITYKIHYKDWQRPYVMIDGVSNKFFLPYTRQYTGSCVRDATSTSFIAEGWVILPHTATSSLTVTFSNGGTASYWGIASYSIDLVATMAQRVTVGGANCPISYTSSSKTVCTPVGANSAQTTIVSLVVASTEYCTGCQYTYSSTATPVISSATMNNLPGVAESDTQLPQFAVHANIQATYANGKASVAKLASGSSSWWSAWFFSPFALRETDAAINGVTASISGANTVIGLTSIFVTDDSYTPVDFALMYDGSNLQAIRAGVWVNTLQIVNNGDAVTVAYHRDCGCIKASVRRQGESVAQEVFSWETTPTFPLYVAGTLYRVGSGFTNIQLINARAQTHRVVLYGQSFKGFAAYSVPDTTAISINGVPCIDVFVSNNVASCWVSPSNAAVATYSNVRVRSLEGFSSTQNIARSVFSVSPPNYVQGSTAGGHLLTFSGSGFSASTTVTIGSVGCTIVSFTADTISCKTGVAAAGAATIVVATSGNTHTCINIMDIHRAAGTPPVCDSYTFSAASTPSISSAPASAKTGDSIVISGASFLTTESPMVYFGSSAKCTVTAYTATSITCTVPVISATDYTLTVSFASTGMATGSAAVNVPLSVASMNPASSAGSLGQASIVLTGAGFGQNGDSVATATVQVSGTDICSSITRADTKLTCVTSATAWSGVIVVTINDKTANNGVTFTTAPGNAPTVTSFAPTRGGLGTFVAISGTQLSDATMAYVGTSKCQIQTASSTLATCLIIEAVAAGANSITVVTTSRGLSAATAGFTGSASISVDSTYLRVTLGRNAVVDVNGDLLGANSEITAVVGSQPCERAVSSSASTNSKFTCKYNASTDAPTSSDVAIALFSGSDSVSAGATYTYNAAGSVTVTAVSPSTGSAAGMEYITITGSNFPTTLQDITVNLGTAPCYVTEATSSTSFICITSEMPIQDGLAVSVIVAAQGRAAGSFTFNSRLNVDSVSSTDVSVEGGLVLTVSGSGFWDIPNSNSWKYNRAILKIGSRICPIVSSTTTAILCTLPPTEILPRVRNPALVSSYVLPPDELGDRVTFVLNYITANVNTNAVINYRQSSTPRVSSVTVGSSTITIVGTNFAGNGNVVDYAGASCAISSESSTNIVCTPATGYFTEGAPVRVNVPGLGYTAGTVTCAGGQYLTCDGTCLANANCAYADWGITTCVDLANLIMSDTFCHSNGGTDRVGLPFRSDDGTKINFNCPMYSCEGGDCDVYLTIGGMGARFSTCGRNPSGPVVKIAPTVSSLSASQTSVNGGLLLTISGSNFVSNMSRATVSIGGIGCTVTSATTSSIVCRTGASSSAASGVYVYVYIDRVLASGTPPTIAYVSSSTWTPVISSVSPTTFFAGQAVTIIGTGFSTTSQVLFGSKYCTGVVADVSQIICNAPDQSTPRYVAIKADVPGKGYSNIMYKTMRLYIASISPSSGSVNGGTLVTLTGSAFSANTRVSFGTCASTFVSFNSGSSSIVVSTSACSGAQSPVAVDGSTTGTQCGAACTFTFSAAATPVISSVSWGSGTATFTTSNMGANPQMTDATVTFAGVTCTITSFSASSTTCTFTNPTAGTYNLMYLLAPYGYATTTATYISNHAVTSFTPSSGSLGGGQRLTITGTGFSSVASQMKVTIGATGASCTAVSSSYTQVVCLTGATAASYTDIVRVAIVDAVAATAPNVADSSSTYMYDPSVSPTVSSISPSRGSTAGGTILTITGTMLNTAGINVTIDGVECAQTSTQQAATTATSYTCTTGAHTTMFDPKVVRVATLSNGNAINSQTYQYVDLWSRFTTWGNTPPPVRGDSVVISEGTTVMVDYSPPRFFLVIVMGHLLFDWSSDIDFACTYIMINYGRFTVGTPEKPYLKKATITLYGDRLTPEIPVHGSKVIALRFGALDMHGIKRQPTWTRLGATAAASAGKIQVRGPVDWKIGEFIVIASTDFFHEHTEHRMITGVEPADGQASSVTLTLEYPLAYEHYGQQQCFEPGNTAKPSCIDEIAEVGLLTRNIVVQGDPNSMNIGFGGTMFLMPMGETSDYYARLSYVELRQVGQQFIVGRYPVHYHVTGEANNSYVNGTAVHQSLNRAFSIHGVKNNTYVNNVAYDIHGHAFFIEDGSERFNVIDNNFVSHVKVSTSNLNTDLTPANFWIVSPTNKVTNNAAGGGDAYGFWIAPFDPHSTGPTASTLDCPYTQKLWEFNNNVAHSNHKYGFNIFKYWYPKEVECDLNSADAQAVLYNLVAYKNQVWGVTYGNHDQGIVGAVMFDNVISADNGYLHPDAANFWIEVINARNMTNGVKNSLMIARSNNQPNTRTHNRRGVNLAKGDNFFVQNVTFVNYADSFDNCFEPQAWAERMSLCFPYGWEAVAEQIHFVNSPNIMKFRFDHHGILNDMDGSVTGSAGTQLIANSAIFDASVCTTANFNTGKGGRVCPNSYKVRRFGIAMESEIWQPQIWQIEGRMEIVPVITRNYIMTAPVNKKVNISFQAIKVPDTWDWKFGGPTFTQPGEKLLFEIQHNETRDHVYASFNGVLSKAYDGPVPTLADTTSKFSYNNVTSMFYGLMVYPTTSMSVNSYNCPEAGCPMPPLPPGSWDTPCRPYNLGSSWVLGTVPVTNLSSDLILNNEESVCLGAGFTCAAGTSNTFVYEYRLLRVEGSIQFRDEHCPCDGATVHVKVGAMWIRQGGLLVGNATNKLTRCNFRLSIMEPDWFNPLSTGPVTVRPWGARSLILESGMLLLNGAVPTPAMAHLVATAAVGATSISLDRAATSWKVGDWIYIASTDRRHMYTHFEATEDPIAAGNNQRERRQITSISSDMRTLTFIGGLRFEHYGTAGATVNGKTYQIGAEVILANRNVVVDGDGDASLNELPKIPAVRGGWQLAVGCTPDNYEGCAVFANAGWPMNALDKPGFLRIDGAWLRGPGQGGLLNGAGIHIDGLQSNTGDAFHSYFRNSVVERAFHSSMMLRHTTSNLKVEGNIFLDPEGDGIAILGSGNNINANIIMGSGNVYTCDLLYHIFPECRASGIRVRGSNTVTNNIVAGHLLIGILTDGDFCENPLSFSGNYLHSNRDGMVVYDTLMDANMNYPTTGVPTTCRKIGGIVSYWNGDHGLTFWYVKGSIQVNDVTVIENTIGISSLLQAENSLPTAATSTATYRNLVVAGFFDGMKCRSAEHFWDCTGSLVDSKFWCKRLLHGEDSYRKIGTAGILETVFVSAELGIGRTKGEKKFRWEESDSYATMVGQAIHENVVFANFDGNDACGLRNIAFHNNIFSNDTFKHHIFRNVTWAGEVKNGGEYYATKMYGQARIITAEREATWFHDYDNTLFGGFWPDAPNKNLIIDADGTFTKTGVRSSVVADESLVRPTTFDKLGYSGRAFVPGSLDPPVAGCTFNALWNAHVCDNKFEWVSFTIDSLAEDALTRRPGPVVMCQGDGMIDINGWPLCQGGRVQYASGPVMKGKVQRATLDRLTRYKFHVLDRQNLTLSFRGSPPAWMRMILHDHEYTTAGSNTGITVNLRFFGLNSQLRQAVYVDGVRIKPNVGYGFPWTYGQTWPGPRDPAGTHFHNKLIVDTKGDGLSLLQYNVLYFTMRPGSVLEIKAEEIVQLTMGVSIPLDNFFTQKDTFVVALASTLGIDSSRIKFSNIVAGSDLAVNTATSGTVSTSRRAAYALATSTGNTSIVIDIAKREGDAQTSYSSSSNVNDWSSVLSSLSAINSGASIGGMQVFAVSSAVQPVEYAYRPITVQAGIPYIACNATQAASTNSDPSTFKNVNQTLMQELLMNYYIKTYPTRSPYNSTTLQEAGVSNVFHNTNTSWSQVVFSLGYEDNIAIRDGLLYIKDDLGTSNTTAQKIFPNHLIRDCYVSYNGWVESASNSTSSASSNSTLVFGLAVGLSLAFVLIVCLAVAYYYFCVRPKQAAKKVDKEMEEYADEPISASGAPARFDAATHPADQYDELGRPYFYDEEGQPYYYDENGRAHYYYDTHASEAPMFDEVGRQYFYDEQGQPYFLNEAGNPQYYYSNEVEKKK